MARLFVATQSAHLNYPGAPVTVPPYTIAVWVRVASRVAIGRIWTLWNAGSGNEVSALYFQAGTPDAVVHFNYANAVDSYVSPTSAPTVGAWQHVAVAIDGVNDRFIYLNGGNKGTFGSVPAPTGLNQITVGSASAGASAFDGDIAELSIWNVQLSDPEVAALAAAPSALMVRPAALVAHWPILGGALPEIDLVGRRDLALVAGTVAPSPHPRIFWPDPASLAPPRRRGAGGRFFLLFP